MRVLFRSVVFVEPGFDLHAAELAVGAARLGRRSNERIRSLSVADIGRGAGDLVWIEHAVSILVEACFDLGTAVWAVRSCGLLTDFRERRDSVGAGRSVVRLRAASQEHDEERRVTKRSHRSPP